TQLLALFALGGRFFRGRRGFRFALLGRFRGFIAFVPRRGCGCGRRSPVRSPTAAFRAVVLGELGDVHEAGERFEEALLDVLPLLPGDLAEARAELRDVALEEALALLLALSARSRAKALREPAPALLEGQRNLAQELRIVSHRFLGFAGERHPHAGEVDE